MKEPLSAEVLSSSKPVLGVWRAVLVGWLVEYPGNNNHIGGFPCWHGHRIQTLVVVPFHWVLCGLGLVVICDSALAKVGSQTWRTTRKITEVGGRRRINMAQGLDLRKDRISNTRLKAFSPVGSITTFLQHAPPMALF